MAATRGPRRSPVERVREIVGRSAGASVAARIPTRFQRAGRVLLVRLPSDLEPHFGAIGEAWREVLGVESVLLHERGVEGEFRIPTLRTIAGSSTETLVRQNGVRYRFDAARILFAMGNGDERRRVATLVRPGERVADLFAGIGYFSIPVAVHAHPAAVHAVEANPVSFGYLRENIELNDVGKIVTPYEGDNRTVSLPVGSFDRILLGLLPTSVPFLGRAVELLTPSGGWLHVHVISGTRTSLGDVADSLVQELRRVGAEAVRSRAREVKPYGPGRRHDVVDVFARPSG